MKLQALEKADGSIWIVHGEISHAQEAGDVVIALESAADLPDMKYRDCWREKDGEIVIDLPLARAQKLAEIRAARDAKLAESDAEWMKAMSMGQDVAAINAKKQALRDIPASATTDLAAKRAAGTIDSYEPEWP